MLRPEDKEPEVSAFRYYLTAFDELSTERPAGFGVVPIPFTAIVKYFTIFGSGDFEEFLHYIRLMDSTLLRLNRAKKNASGNANAKNSHKN